MKKLSLKLLLIPLTIYALSLIQANSETNHHNKKEHHKYHYKNKQKKNNPLVSSTTEQLQSLQKQEEELFKWVSTWTEVMTIAQDKAFRHVNFAGFIQEALKAAVSRTDAHSAFFPQKLATKTKQDISGKFFGIGISIMGKTPEDETLVIVDTNDDGPAKKAGIKAGDKIVEVDGEKLRGMTSDEVIGKLKGKADTKVKIKILRKKKPLEFLVKREMVKDHSTSCFYFKNQNIYYLALKLFTEPCAVEMRKLLEKANTNQCKGIILDLRHNTGGILETAVEMASLFIPKGSLVVTTKDKNHVVKKSFSTSTEPLLKSKVPIFIIINNFTASASEILAGCLKHYSRLDGQNQQESPLVFLAGTSTFGKGSVQEVIPLSNGCALKLTTMLYYLPDNSSIQACGIEPDFLIKPKKIPHKELKWIDELYGRETAMKFHITKDEVENPNLETNEDGKIINHKKKETQKKPEPTTSEINVSEEDEDSEDDDTSNLDKENKKTPTEKQKDAIGQDITVQACINMIGMLDLAKKANPELITTRAKALTFLKDNYLTDNPVELEKIG